MIPRRISDGTSESIARLVALRYALYRPLGRCKINFRAEQAAENRVMPLAGPKDHADRLTAERRVVKLAEGMAD